MNELEQENAFYEANKDEFRQKYLNKWLLITGNKLWGAYDKIADAAEEALKQDMEPGHFMIHKPADDDMIIEIGPIISTSRPGFDEDAESNSKLTIAKGETIAYSYAY